MGFQEGKKRLVRLDRIQNKIRMFKALRKPDTVLGKMNLQNVYIDMNNIF